MPSLSVTNALSRMTRPSFKPRAKYYVISSIRRGGKGRGVRVRGLNVLGAFALFFNKADQGSDSKGANSLKVN